MSEKTMNPTGLGYDHIRMEMNDDTKTPVEVSKEHILQFFSCDYLPPQLQQISASFQAMAYEIISTIPRNQERTVALRKLIESMDATLRAYRAVPTV